MMITGEIVKEGSRYMAGIDALGAYADGRSRTGACEALAAVVRDIAADHRALDGFQVTITHDGDATLALTSNDPARLASMLLRCQREEHEMSLADVAQALGAKSRNSYAQYEAGRSEPSIGKLQELLAAVAPEYMLAIVPRTAQVLPRHVDHGDEAEIAALLEDPSPANAEALNRKRRPATGT